MKPLIHCLVLILFSDWCLVYLEAAERFPNILLILSDDHSARFLGCYGNKAIQTPNPDLPGVRSDLARYYDEVSRMD